jgi:hypothetical protein
VGYSFFTFLVHRMLEMSALLAGASSRAVVEMPEFVVDV